MGNSSTSNLFTFKRSLFTTILPGPSVPPPPPIGFAKEAAKVKAAVDTTAPTSGVVAKAADADAAETDAAETKAAEANAGAKAAADEPATGHEDANSESPPEDRPRRNGSRSGSGTASTGRPGLGGGTHTRGDLALGSPSGPAPVGQSSPAVARATAPLTPREAQRLLAGSAGA